MLCDKKNPFSAWKRDFLLFKIFRNVSFIVILFPDFHSNRPVGFFPLTKNKSLHYAGASHSFHKKTPPLLQYQRDDLSGNCAANKKIHSRGGFPQIYFTIFQKEKSSIKTAEIPPFFLFYYGFLTIFPPAITQTGVS